MSNTIEQQKRSASVIQKLIFEKITEINALCHEYSNYTDNKFDPYHVGFLLANLAPLLAKISDDFDIDYPDDNELSDITNSVRSGVKELLSILLNK